ncbi:scm-like with four MBT domains protein 1 [Trichonephila clavipes]|nr:scm-like with four MBT domains protein 1 [Trichonephila clavipes]
MLPFCPNDFDDNNITKIAARAEESRQLARVHTLRAQDKDRRRYDSKHQMVLRSRRSRMGLYSSVGLSEKLLRRKLREVVHVLRMKPYHDPAEQIETEDIPPKESYKGPITRSRIKALEQNDSGALSSFRGEQCHTHNLLQVPIAELAERWTELPQVSGQQCKSWCPKIYFNHRCFTGPLLSKSRLAELPQAIGPGPLHLVIQEVIYRVVNIAYKSSRVLQILQVNGKPSPGMQQQIIKAKYKGKTNRATIEVIRNSEQVEEFCKNICQKLECCPYLFGPKHVGEVCPSSCHTQTKTKFGYNFVKKHKKIGRPPLNPNAASTSAENEEVVKKGPGRKKKRKHWTHLLNNARSLENQPPVKIAKSRDSSETDEGSKCDTKEKSPSQTNKIPLIGKKKLKHTPSSSIVTRGAKLPNFGLWHHVSPFHSRRGRPRTRPIRPFPPRKVGRPVGSTKKAIAAQMKNKAMIEDSIMQSETLPSRPKPTFLDSNPLEWSVEDVVQYLQKTDYAPLAPLLKEQEIDGQALLMLNLFNVQEYLHLKPEPAKRFCYLIKNLKVEFFTHYVS